MALPYSRALVTGATGFIGTHLCQALAAQGVAVHALTIDGEVPPELKLPNLTTHAADITNTDAVSAAVERAQPEIVFHLAAYGTPTHERDVAQMIAVNITGTQNLLTASVAQGCRQFIQTGSIKEYGTSRTPITEAAPLRPWDNYAATKAAAGYFCRLAAERHGLPMTVLRFSPAYGPGESNTRFVPAAIRAALNGTPFTISVSSLVRNFTYIDDVVSAFLAAATQETSGYDEFNIGADQAHSFDDILTAIEAATAKPITRIVDAPANPKDDSWVIDSSKAQHVLGWHGQHSLSDGVARTVAWYHARHQVAV